MNSRFIAAIAVCALLVSACSSDKGYEKTFSQKTALNNNSHRYEASVDQAFRAAKISMVQQGFAIQQLDAANGLLKGLRTYDDPKKTDIAYLVTATIDITAVSDTATIVTVSASQQTVLHKDSEKYFHLLGLVPIPTGKEYQTVVRSEGDITGASFYQDLFAAISRNMPAAAPPVVVTALPAAPAAVAVPVTAPVAAPPAAVPAAAATDSSAPTAPAAAAEPLPSAPAVPPPAPPAT